jgi:hypothetical protein
MKPQKKVTNEQASECGFSNDIPFSVVTESTPPPPKKKMTQ